MNKTTGRQRIAIHKVASLLVARKAKGVSCLDFPTGFALRSRISDLRWDMGWEIKTIRRSIGPLAKYILVKQPKAALRKAA